MNLNVLSIETGLYYLSISFYHPPSNFIARYFFKRKFLSIIKVFLEYNGIHTSNFKYDFTGDTVKLTGINMHKALTSDYKHKKFSSDLANFLKCPYLQPKIKSYNNISGYDIEILGTVEVYVLMRLLLDCLKATGHGDMCNDVFIKGGPIMYVHVNVYIDKYKSKRFKKLLKSELSKLQNEH